jgi:hypothetical protein
MSLRFSRLTRPAIRQLEPGQKITENGIAAEKLADGDVRYTVGIMVDGKRVHRVIGKGATARPGHNVRSSSKRRGRMRGQDVCLFLGAASWHSHSRVPRMLTSSVSRRAAEGISRSSADSFGCI